MGEEGEGGRGGWVGGRSGEGGRRGNDDGVGGGCGWGVCVGGRWGNFYRNMGFSIFEKVDSVKKK